MSENPLIESPESEAAKPRGCGFLFFGGMILMGAIWGAFLGAFVYILEDSEDIVASVEEFRPKIGSRLVASDRSEMGEFTLETRTLVPLNQIPLKLQKAFIATEDDTFYTHKGVRPLALTKAVLDALRTNHLRGASTITQQIVRNIDKTGITKEQTVQRKLQEMLAALQLERKYTKDEILEMYLNQIFLGVSAHGVESASRQYFLKSVSDLTLGESAMLAGLTRAPNKNQPFRHAENARIRRDIVLKQMLNNGFITVDEYNAALVEDLNQSVITPDERELYLNEEERNWRPNRFKAPYFAEEVRKFITRPPAPYELDVTGADLFEDGLEITTTLDPVLQELAEDILFARLDLFDKEKMEDLKAIGKEHEFKPVSGALVCLDNRIGPDYDYRGFVRAMVGGRNYAQTKFNMATQAKRQPGSSVKPFVWLAALDNGMTPSDYIVDRPAKYYDVVGTLWEPKNFGDEYAGPIPIRVGLELSKNIVSIKLADRFKTPLIRSYLRSAGFRLPMTEGLSLALGTSETTVIDQAECYSTLVNGGIHIEPTMITQIRDRDGIIRYDHKQFRNPERVFPADVSYQVVHLMQGVCEPTGRYNPSGRRTDRLARPRGGKTGTTNDSTDLWFCGFTAQYTCIIWIGYEQPASLGEGVRFTGGALASPVWTDFMIGAHEGLPVKDFKVPAGVEFYNIDRQTGLTVGKYNKYPEAYIRGTKPPDRAPVFEMEGELETLSEPRMFQNLPRN
jgi:penicillin-binding protein 1A